MPGNGCQQLEWTREAGCRGFVGLLRDNTAQVIGCIFFLFFHTCRFLDCCSLFFVLFFLLLVSSFPWCLSLRNIVVGNESVSETCFIFVCWCSQLYSLTQRAPRCTTRPGSPTSSPWTSIDGVLKCAIRSTSHTASNSLSSVPGEIY